MHERRRCDGCRHWHQFYDAEAGDYIDSGTCQRRLVTPRGPADIVRNPLGFDQLRQVTMHDDTCRDWMKSEPTTDES